MICSLNLRFSSRAGFYPQNIAILLLDALNSAGESWLVPSPHANLFRLIRPTPPWNAKCRC
jgi:hypothetical protein